MPKRLIDIRSRVPLLDIASYARRGPGHRDRLSPADVQQIARTVRRTPEVMVKVLSIPIGPRGPERDQPSIEGSRANNSAGRRPPAPGGFGTVGRRSVWPQLRGTHGLWLIVNASGDLAYPPFVPQANERV